MRSRTWCSRPKPPTSCTWGWPGVGRTHLSAALAFRAIVRGQGGHFVRACDLIEDIGKARAGHRPDRRMPIYPTPNVVIVDESSI